MTKHLMYRKLFPFIVAALTLGVRSSALSQASQSGEPVKIHEKISITPKKTESRMVQRAGASRTITGSVSGDYTSGYVLLQNSACTVSGEDFPSVSVPAYGIGITASAQINSLGGAVTYTVNLSGCPIPMWQVTAPASIAPYQVDYSRSIDLQSDYTWAAGLASIFHGDVNALNLANTRTSCSTTVWYVPGDDITFSITAGAQYGHIRLGPNGALGTSFTAKFGDLSVGIQYVADGVQPLAGVPAPVTVNASVPAAGLSHDVTFNVNCRMTLTQQDNRYSQGDPSWANDTFDHVTPSEEMYQGGCAVSCVAMVLKAYGYPQMTPKELNSWMSTQGSTTQGGYGQQGNMNWHVPFIREGITEQTVRKPGVGDPAKATSTTVLDANLPDNCKVPIVQVWHQKTDGTHGMHYVVVTGKVGNDYSILDPGDYTKTLLSQLDGKFWSYIIYNIH
jgi:hypothetical protein